MKLPISWLKDFIDLDGLTVEDLARKLTLAGLEVDEILYAGLPMPVYGAGEKHEFKTNGIAWDKEKIVVAEIREVKAHPNADKLTLLDLFDGQQEQVVLTGAPNIFHLKGAGKLEKPIKVAYAKEGSTLYDGHADGQVLMTLKRAKIRGVDSYSMVCSEKELGITEESDGIIILDDDAPVGMPLADYIGDAVLDISILPNMARNANVIGIARELAALTGRKLKQPVIELKTSGASVEDLVSIEIINSELNPRFVAGLIRNVEIKPSPYQIQRRLKLAGVRAINNIVDATNYAMIELGEPLHAFDYDVLKERAGDKKIKIITRTAQEGEELVTLDGVKRKLTAMNVLVCDEKGSLSLAGVMGGSESEVYDASKEILDVKGIEVNAGEMPQGKITSRGKSTVNILLEGAAWNFINIRRTAKQHNLPSEASFRFSRGVHPAIAETGVKRGLQYMAAWANGQVAPGLVDVYPLKPKDSVVEVTPKDVKRLLGIELTAEEISTLLTHLEFKCEITGGSVKVTAPAHRMDIEEGVVGLADVLEEVARSYGFDKIPTTTMSDALPPQVGNPVHEWEERLRDLLVAIGLQEVVTYRMTSPEREGRVIAYDEYVRIANPIAPERSVLRQSLLASVLEVAEKNAKAESIAMFEVGSVFEPVKNDLPNEPRKLGIVMTGARIASAWDVKTPPAFDFYDMKGRIELLLAGLRFTDIVYAEASSSYQLHPGKSAEVKVSGQVVGVFGELHPLAKEKYEFGDAPVIVAEFDLEKLRTLNPSYGIVPVSEFPPMYEDIAIILDESVAASAVEALIRQTGGKTVTDVRLFDVYRDEKIGAGKKSLAYSLTYQAEKTLTDADAATIRNKIVKRLENTIGAKLRS
ncbi:MAG: phenylalanine--tRNA ligase subunit beta [Anaerolineales bacterium]|uniref:phenylalanine--tRNA ligase subunit beta n=1 Tax=Candidatus Villigracilis proximus TaxID=3140683 RepID=UPI0031354917|nr:phenylalanine--tRNA ligase subunit beta [Anaerolineales bacterium]